MRAYARDLGIGYEVKAYGGGLMMVKDASRGQGRCLFFALRREADGSETIVALLVYKKESQEAPKRVLETARRRMGEME